MSNNKFKVLIVEDEANICSFIETLLTTNDYQALVAHTCTMGLTLFASHNPDLVILDLGLPARDGLELLRTVRQKYMTPIIVLSARTDEMDKIEALDLGANDYITKPFGTGELLARVRAALRLNRYGAPLGGAAPNGEFCAQGLRINYDRRKVFVEGEEVKLTQTEYNIVAFLSQHAGRVMTYAAIVKAIWGDTAIGRKLPVDPSWARLEEQPAVTGVVEDVRNMGFFQGQTCTAFILNARVRPFNVRLKAPLDDNLQRLNAFVKSAYPDLSLEFTTYQDIRREQNASVSTFRNTVWVTTACIILIVLMGLIGYVSDETQRRSKEIAVRKVNGAEASDILRLLSLDILKIAVLAVAAGMAAAWYVSGQWMQQFAASRLLSPAWYALLALLLLVLIVAIVVLKAWRIANENPVLSIKSE